MVKIVHVALLLPDGRVALHRRDSNTLIAPNKLAFFGGHVELGESPDQAMQRELHEETSLDVASLDMRLVQEFELTGSSGELTHFYTYRTLIANPDFEVYEGSGVEVYSVDEALARGDIVSSVRHALMKIGG